MNHRSENGGIRVLGEFVCDAIPTSGSLAPGTGSAGAGHSVRNGNCTQPPIHDIADAGVSQQFYATVSSIPRNETEWTIRQSTFQGWRGDPGFAAFWPMLDRLLTLDFASTKGWSAAADAIRELDSEAYDFDAWHNMRESSRTPLNDRAP